MFQSKDIDAYVHIVKPSPVSGIAVSLYFFLQELRKSPFFSNFAKVKKEQKKKKKKKNHLILTATTV